MPEEGFYLAEPSGPTAGAAGPGPHLAGSEHSFANRDVALYTPKQAGEAWPITVAFLRDHLR